MSEVSQNNQTEDAKALHQLIYNLELTLLDSSVRKSAQQLDLLLADDFMEIGSSGKFYNKTDVMAALLNESSTPYSSLKNFKTQEIASNVILATYEIKMNGQNTLRSSIWKKFGNNWLMLFHQGTKAA